ncbi:MAG: photosynthetic complex assembly protein PuhC [bacterium]
MSYLHIEDEPVGRPGVPRAALAVAGAMAVLTIVLAAVARISHAGTLGEDPHATIVNSRALVFSDRPDGSIGVVDATRHEVLPPIVGQGGFVRGSLRALARQRRLAAVGPEVPFYLIRWSDGRLTLDDSATHNHLELQAFGVDNAAAYVPLLPAR